MYLGFNSKRDEDNSEANELILSEEKSGGKKEGKAGRNKQEIKEETRPYTRQHQSLVGGQGK